LRLLRRAEKKFREIIKYFSLDLNAVQIQKLTRLSRQTINKYLHTLRVRIFKITKDDLLQSVPLVGQIEVDESYFGPRRVRGKRGRGARGKTVVFGLLKRGDKVYTQIIKKFDRATLYAIIDDYTSKESIIDSDGWRGYNGLVDFGYKKHYRVDHSKNEFARGKSHVNGIESF
jgi:transposase-like protein